MKNLSRSFREAKYRIKLRGELGKLDTDTFNITKDEVKREDIRRNQTKGNK